MNQFSRFHSTRLILPQWSQPRWLWLLLLLGAGIASPAFAQPYPGERSTVLRPNDQGDAVVDLQRRLSGLGYYSGPVTGQFDASTQTAVSRFQQEHGLAVDGIVGPATSSALGGSAAVSQSSQSTAAQPGQTSSSILEVQRQLTQLGYYKGAANGTYDSQTQNAVMSFQRDRGLAVDGIVGSATEAALSQSKSSSQSATQATTPTSPSAYTPAATPSDGLLKLGDVGSEVSTLQTRLQALGYYDGPISGSFGSQTQSALMAFQQAQGLTVDGIAGPRVNAALSRVATGPTNSVPSAANSVNVAPAPIAPSAVPSTVTPAVSQPAGVPAMPQQVMPPTQTGTAPTMQVPSAPISGANSPAQVAQPLPPDPPGMNQQGSNRNIMGERFGVSELQRRLQNQGVNSAQPSGVYDSQTQNAINQVQQKYRLSPSDF
jgi:peptidoglycan hydrolase-like protein with peptidoglycan-binding domain